LSEIWDLYDKNGNRANIIIPKGGTIPKEYYHLVVEVYVITNESEILVTKRVHSKLWWPDEWENTQGSVISGENARQAAVRELKEETGIVVNENTLMHIFDYIHENNPSIFVGFITFVDKNRIDIKMNTAEVAEYKFLRYEEFEDFIMKYNFVEWTKIRYMANKHKINHLIRQHS